MEQEQQLEEMRSRLLNERSQSPKTAGSAIVQEHLNMQRHMNINNTEEELIKQTKLVEKLRQEMKEAQIECKVMEKVITSIQEEERKEYERKVNIINDEIAVLGWSRRK